MCRLIALACRGEACREVGVPLIKSLVKAAKYDHLLKPLVKGEPRHCDGFGYVLYTPSLLTVMKYDAADYLGVCTEACENNLRTLEAVAERVCEELEHVSSAKAEAYLVMHARRAGRREPRGSIHAHPYVVTYLGRAGPKHYFLVHNGGVDKDRIANEVMRASLDTSLITDSNVFAEALLKEWGGEDLSEFKVKVEALLKYLKTALVTATLVMGVTGAYIVATSYIREDLTTERRRYYTTYLIRGKDFAAIASSTVYEYLREVKPELEAEVLEGVEVIRV